MRRLHALHASFNKPQGSEATLALIKQIEADVFDIGYYKQDPTMALRCCCCMDSRIPLTVAAGINRRANLKAMRTWTVTERSNAATEERLKSGHAVGGLSIV